MFILLIFEVFITEIIIESSVDKLDNKILKQQIDFFAPRLTNKKYLLLLKVVS